MTEERYEDLYSDWAKLFNAGTYTFEDMADWAEVNVPDLFEEIDRLREIEWRLKELER